MNSLCQIQDGNSVLSETLGLELTWQPDLTHGKLPVKEATPIYRDLELKSRFPARLTSIFSLSSSASLPAIISVQSVCRQFITCERVGFSLSSVLQSDIRNSSPGLL